MSTQIGHGRSGLQDRLQDFIDLTSFSANSKDAVIVLKPIMEVTDWSLDDGTTYVIPFEQRFDGFRLDVSGVKSLLDTGLTRVESLALCRSTAGSFFYDSEEEFESAIAQWDDGVTKWDNGVTKWDQFPKLYVHLTDGSNPTATTVVVQLSVYFSNRSMVQPELGPNKLINGKFANWTDGALDNWDSVVTGVAEWDDGVTNWDDGSTWDPSFLIISQESTIVRRGSSSLNHSVSGSQTAVSNRTLTDEFIVGKYYRVFGYYRATSDGATPKISIDDGTNYITLDGRHRESSEQLIELQGTGEEWREFFFDFRAWATTLNLKLHTVGSGSGGSVYWDSFEFKRVWRFNQCDPRLNSSSVPRLSTGSSDIFFGGKSIGSGSISILNGDGLIEKLVGSYEWLNQEVLIYTGRSSLDGQEIPLNDYRLAMRGLIQRITVDDEAVKYSVQDIRAFFHRVLPPNIYDDVTFANLNTKSFLGKPRPIFFGVKSNITPVRIDLTADLFGVYELCDVSLAPNGITAVDTVYAYLDTTAANEKRVDKRIELVEGTSYSVDLNLARITILGDIGPYEITTANNKIDFDEGGSSLVATLNEGLYTAAGLAAEIQLQMIAAGSANLVCTYSNSTYKFTIGKGSGTLNLLIKTGDNKEIAVWKTIGFKPSADNTGSLSYEGDSAVFTDVDRNHTVRADAQGYKDDSLGTFTGIPSSLIETGADIARVILVKYMGKSTSIIDEDSFVFARQRAPESLAIYLNELTSTQDIFNRLEFSNIANIVVNGEGNVFYKVYVGEIPANIKTINDHAISSFRGEKSTSDVYSAIRVAYDRDPSSGVFKTRQASDESVGLRLGRPELKEFQTYLKLSDSALSAANRMLELARSAARKISVDTEGGEFVDLEVGDKVKLNRNRALSRGGKITDEVFRIISITKQQQEGKVGMDLTDDRITVASQACIQTCQAFCESTCQLGCQQACQSICESTCQNLCESSCQQACELGCQESCQLGCQTSCETGCQTTCQSSCQAQCEGGGCQTACESSCQLACQSACQTVCQASCQGACQTGCQSGCEVNCQSGCEANCQQACELGCQSTCQLGCQQTCEVSCQSGCQTGACQFPSESPEN